MKYFDIPVTVVAAGETLEEAQNNVWLFMPWTHGSRWTIDQHNNIELDKIDSWHIAGVDDNAMEAMLRERGLR